jgi:hypothetical protein
MANTYTLIASNTLSSASANVNFTSIPTTYSDLVLVMSVRSSTSATTATLRLLLNNDSNLTGYYSRTNLYGNGATVTSNRDSNDNKTQIIFANADTSTSNTFSNIEVYIPAYTASQNKPFSVFNAMETNATTAYVTGQAALWRQTTAVNEINLSWVDSNNFVSGSSFYLYGIKNVS